MIPINSVQRIMKEMLSENVEFSKDTTGFMQSCLSKLITHMTTVRLSCWLARVHNSCLPRITLYYVWCIDLRLKENQLDFSLLCERFVAAHDSTCILVFCTTLVILPTQARARTHTHIYTHATTRTRTQAREHTYTQTYGRPRSHTHDLNTNA